MSSISPSSSCEFAEIGDISLISDSLAQWSKENPHLPQYITFLTLLSGQNERYKQRFVRKRTGIIRRLTDELNSFSDRIEKKQAQIAEEIARRSASNIPSLLSKPFDDNQNIMLLRIHTRIRQKIHKHQISYLTCQYGYLCDKIADVKAFLKCLSLVPPHIVIRLVPQFFDINFEHATLKDTDRLKRLFAYFHQLEGKLAKLPKAKWFDDFNGFYHGLIKQAEERVDLDLSYFPPIDLEVSLSRYYFSNPKRCEKIDEQIKTIKTLDGESFINSLIDMCYNYMPFKDTASMQEQSISLLIIFRCFFNRVYELFPSRFAPGDSPDLWKISALSKLGATHFPLPRHLIKVVDPTITIRELFRQDSAYAAASQFFEESFYQPTPIDALFDIHKCLSCIHKGAIINQADGQQISNPREMGQMLCFDELFSLFFGVLMGSDIGDVFALADFIEQYSPKQALSPSFEYAQANLEALVLHCRNQNPELIASQIEDKSIQCS